MPLERFFSVQATEAAAEGAGLAHWRARLLDVFLRVGLAVGMVPTLIATALGISRGEFGNTLAAALSIGAVALMVFGRVSYRWRARVTLALLYALGVWALLRGGALSQSYLLACPVLAGLLLSRRSAIALLAWCSISVIAAGPFATSNLWPQAPAGGWAGLSTWLDTGANFAFVGSLLVLSSAFLLRHLEQSLGLQRQAAESMRHNQQTMEQIASHMPGWMFQHRLLPDGRLEYVYVSSGIRRFLGIEPQALLADGALVRNMWHPDDVPRIQQDLAEALRSGQPMSHEFRVVLPDGSVRWLQSNFSAATNDPHGVVRNGIMVDITDRKAAEEQAWQRANFDTLTGLPNREFLHERLEQLLAAASPLQQPLSLMLVDLDHFKEVNDTLGHNKGDQLLIEAARRIRACVRDSDVVARMGGDEFTIILPRLGQPQRVERIAQQVLGQLAEPFVLDGERVYLSASIGITRYPHDALNIEDLLKAVDQALYVAKGAGRNRFSYFTPELQAQAQQRVRLSNDLRLALDRGQLALHYQPIVDLGTGRISKAEALLRWQHPERGWVSPAEFIPVAESTGLIDEIGDWVFRTAAAQVQQWRSRLDAGFQISVNRSPVQFRSANRRGLDWVRTLAEMALPGEAIVVEITEGLLLDATDDVARQLLAFRDAGIVVAMDDFGTGYSSLSYLQQMDIDLLKIDRRFVAALGEGESSGALCKAIIVMAHQLGLKVVAEGVETAAQAEWLRQAGCDFAQGYHYARPLPPEAFEATLAQMAVQTLSQTAEAVT
jgi:diguanylate cyclase (GGDEF)-like protein/PAS domain S-box-containing protein